MQSYPTLPLCLIGMRLSLDGSLIPIKVYYFLTTAGTAAIFPYLPIFAKGLGFNKAEVGVIYAIFPITIIFGNVFVGILADKVQKYKLILMVLHMMKVFSVFPMYFITPISHLNQETVQFSCIDEQLMLNNFSWSQIPPKEKNESLSTVPCEFNCQQPSFYKNSESSNNISWIKVNFTFIQNHSSFYFSNLQEPFEVLNLSHYCPNYINITCIVISCHGELNFTNGNVKESTIRFTSSFIIFLLLRLIIEVSLKAGEALADAIAMEQLKEKSLHYGRIRLLGSLGYGISSMVFGYVFDAYSEGEPKIDYLIGFISSSGFFALSALTVGIFFKKELSPKSHHFLQDFKEILIVPKNVIFLVVVMLDGMVHNFCATYFLWFLTDIGGSQANLGWAIFLSCAAEVPFFLFSGKLIGLLGTEIIMVIVFIGWGIRIILYTVIKIPWGMIPVELLHGITFALFYANMTANVKATSTPGTLATSQEMHTSSFSGLGAVFGNLLGGFVFEKYGARPTFRGFSISCFSIAVIYFAITIVLKKFKIGEKKQMPVNEIIMSETLISDPSGKEMTML